MAKTIYLLEKNPRLQLFLEERLVKQGGIAVVAFKGVANLGAYLKQPPDLLLLSLGEDKKGVDDLLRTHGPQLAAKGVPVFLIGESFTSTEIEMYQSYGCKRIFDRPLRIDELLLAVGTALNIRLDIDDTPSVLDAHVNDDVLYVEIGLGFNSEKLGLLKYRIRELLELYKIKTPKVILMLNDYSPGKSAFDEKKLFGFLDFLLDLLGGRAGWIKILCRNSALKEVLSGQVRFAEIGVVPSLEEALDGLMVSTNKDLFNENLLRSLSQESSDLSLRLMQDSTSGKQLKVAVVDDDFVVQEIVKNTLDGLPIQVTCYDDGKSFLNTLSPDIQLIFLDLMMPGLTGFDVLERLKQANVLTPVIIMSALGRRETVIRAMSFGIKSYLIKPLKPADILRKVKEVLELPL